MSSVVRGLPRRYTNLQGSGLQNKIPRGDMLQWRSETLELYLHVHYLMAEIRTRLARCCKYHKLKWQRKNMKMSQK